MKFGRNILTEFIYQNKAETFLKFKSVELELLLNSKQIRKTMKNNNHVTVPPEIAAEIEGIVFIMKQDGVAINTRPLAKHHQPFQLS